MRLILGIVFCMMCGSASIAEDDLYALQSLPPLRRVVFYNSGVAHMQHRGQVEGKAKLEIRFSGHDVDDVLKSLVFEDRGGGVVRAVEYQPAPNPEDVAANEFVPMTLAQLLQKYRGESVGVFMINEPALTKGKIFGLENRQIGDTVEEVLVLVDKSGSMRSLLLNEVDRIEFSNQAVRDEMQLALTGIAKSRKANQKRLDLMFDGNGKREVAFGYVVDAPIWRMSYRLEVQPEQIKLHGWTHINNVTGVNWEDVAIELRSGQPQTFQADLFAPVLSERRSVGLSPFGLPKELTLVHQYYGFEPAPRFGSGWQPKSDMQGLGGGMGGMGGMGGGLFGGGSSRDNNRDGKSVHQGIDPNTAFQQIASLDRTASLIRFQLDDLVSLESGKSAALPVFEEQLPSRLLSVVKHEGQGDQLTPIRSIELTNATQFALVPGPVSVSRAGDFVGDAQIPRLSIGASTLLPYAIDRAIIVRRTQSPKVRRALNLTIRQQKVLTTYESRLTVQFVIDNQDKDPRQLVLEYQLPSDLAEEKDKSRDPFASFSDSPRIPKLTIQPAPKSRNNDDLLTYELTAPALSQSKLVLQIRWSDVTEDPIRNLLPTRVAAWLNSDLTIDDRSRKILSEFVSVTRSLIKQRSKVGALTAKKAEFGAEQTRVRENLRAVGAGSAAAEPFLQLMNQMETSILLVNEQLADAKQKLQELEQVKNSLGN